MLYQQRYKSIHKLFAAVKVNFEQDEKDIHRLKLKKQHLLNRAVSLAFADSTGSLFPELIELMSSQDDWQSKTTAYRLLKYQKMEAEAQEMLQILQEKVVSFPFGETEKGLNISDLESGIYLVKVGTQMQKLVVE